MNKVFELVGQTADLNQVTKNKSNFMEFYKEEV